MVKLLLIAGGGALGSVARYGLSVGVRHVAPGIYPWDTTVVNLFGCFLFGVVFGIIERGALLPEGADLALLVGVLGGFTTFSAFAYQNTVLLAEGRLGLLALNLAVQNFGGILLTLGGIALVRATAGVAT